MTYTDLLSFNPWWESKEKISQDIHLQKFDGEKIKYSPVLEAEKGITVVRGPRQVGKTTLMKLKIRDLLLKGTDPADIFFYSFELKRKPDEIYEIVSEYLHSVKKGHAHLFLDEVTTILEWSRAIKLFVDKGDLTEKDATIITGSSSVDLQKGSDRLPGRGIEGNEYFYFPCSFCRYLELRGIVLERCDPADPKQFFEFASKNLSKLLTLNSEFSRYLQHGGFLYAINNGKSELTLERYARWLEGDFIKWQKNPQVVKEILQAIIKKSGSQFGFNSIAKECSVSSHNTISDYLSMLDEELFLKTLNKTELPWKIQRRKEKKAMFLDPLLISVAEHWADQRLDESIKIEQTVASHLSRLGSVAFYNDGKKEIDCILKIGSGQGRSEPNTSEAEPSGHDTLGIEVKWSSSISRSDTYAVRKTTIPYVLSKDVLKIENDVPVVPVSLFLAMLDAGEFVKRDLLALQ